MKPGVQAMIDALVGPLIDHPHTHRLGWTLIHTLWQGLGLALLLRIGLQLLPQHRNALRHNFMILVLLAWLAVPALTFVMLAPKPTQSLSAANVAAAEAPITRTTTLNQTPSAAPTVEDGTRAEIGFSSTSPTRYLQRLAPYAALAWLVVATLLSVRLLGGVVVTHRLSRRGDRLPALETSIRRLSIKLGIGRRVRLLVSTRIDVPTAIGWLQPVVLLPTSAVTGLTTQQLELIIAHELAHIRRHDYLVNLLQGVCEALLFYHPFTWWLSRSLRVEREHACDELALRVTGAAPLTLAEGLTRLEADRGLPTPALAATTNLLPRIRRLLGAPQAPRPRTPALLPLIPLVSLVLWLALTAQAAEPTIALFEPQADGAIVTPYPDAPEGGWETYHTLSDISARTSFPLRAPTYLPPGFRFANATWDEQVELVSLTYGATSSAPSAGPFSRSLTLMQLPAEEYRPLPVGLDANIEVVTVGGAAGEYVTGYWAGDWLAPDDERHLRWLPFPGQILAWREGDMVYVLGVDQNPMPEEQPLARDELLAMAQGLTVIGTDPSPSSNIALPTNKNRLWATLLGEIWFGADYSETPLIEMGGKIIIEERSPTLAQRVVVAPTMEGAITYEYTENGQPAPFDEEARAWYLRTLATAVLAPLRSQRLDQRAPRYHAGNREPDRNLSLIGLQDERSYTITLPSPLDSRGAEIIGSKLELLAHGAAHGVIDQGMLEVALYAFLDLREFDTTQHDAFRFAIAHLDSEAARQRLLDRLD